MAPQRFLKAATNVVVADEQLLDDQEDPMRLKSAQIGSYIYRGQDDQTFGNRSGTVTPAYPCPVSSLGL